MCMYQVEIQQTDFLFVKREINQCVSLIVVHKKSKCTHDSHSEQQKKQKKHFDFLLSFSCNLENGPQPPKLE